MRTKKRIIAAITALVLIAALAGPLVSPTPALAASTILHPNAVGHSTNLSLHDTTNWGACSTADGDTSYVYRDSTTNTYYTDTYNLTNPGLTGTINSVTVWMEAKRESTSMPQASARTVMRIDGADNFGTARQLTTDYASYSTLYTTKPGGAAWSWTDIDNLEAGVSFRRSGSQYLARWSRCTHVWVVVDYTEAAGPGITVSPTSGLVTTEGGGTGSFTVVLDTLPTADVTVGISSDDTSEGTASPASLTFGTGNWSAKQTVTVTGVNDDVEDGDIPYSIVTAAAVSSDSNYNGINPADVAVTNNDDDTAGVTIVETAGSTDVDEEGPTSDTYSVELDSEPTHDVGISITPDAQVTVDPTALTFGSGNWSTPQDVTVTAVDDADIECPHTGTISHSASSTDAKYNGISIDDVIANIADNDGADLAVQMAMMLDGSGSISDTTWNIMLDGLAAAVQNVTCVPHDCSVELTVIQFSSDAHLEVGPVVISESNVADVAADILDLEDEQMEDMTCIACGICLAANVLHDHPDAHFDPAIKQALNLVTDGDPNKCCNCTTDCSAWECKNSSCSGTTAEASAEAAREYALNLLEMTADQDEFDAEFMGTQGTTSDWLRDEIVWPEQAGGNGYYAPPFDKGPGWVRVVANADEFAETICEKFALITQPGSITIEKETDPSPDLTDTSFNFTAEGGLNPSSFSLKDGDNQQFSGLAPGAYNVTEDVPDCWELDSVACAGGDCTAITDGVTVHLDPGEDITCTFSNTKVCSIGDTLFYDDNSNGVRDPGEDGIEGVEVKLYRWGSWLFEASNTTGADGKYLFTGLNCTGTYKVDVVDGTLPAGVTLTTDNDPLEVTLQGVDYDGADFGYQPPPPPPVGGEAYPVNKLAILMPWITLAMAIILGGVMVVPLWL